ncbi:MAG: hypothetical protein ABI691_14110 [Ginsengibacter sp.]
MRTAIRTGIVMLAAFFSISTLYAQDSSKYQVYYIHEDPVNTSMVAPYEKTATDLVANCKKVKLADGWLTLTMEDYRYIYVTPIKDMGELDKNTFEPLEKSMGREAYLKMFADFDKCYDSHRDYTIVLNKEYSYMPGGVNINPEGTPYRHFTYYYITPQNFAKAREIAKAFHDLYVKKGSKLQYRLYRSGFGEKENYYLVVAGAKSAEEYEKMSAENRILLGDEGKELYGKLLQTISGVKDISATAREDLSYMPGK